MNTISEHLKRLIFIIELTQIINNQTRCFGGTYSLRVCAAVRPDRQKSANLATQPDLHIFRQLFAKQTHHHFFFALYSSAFSIIRQKNQLLICLCTRKLAMRTTFVANCTRQNIESNYPRRFVSDNE